MVIPIAKRTSLSGLSWQQKEDKSIRMTQERVTIKTILNHENNRIHKTCNCKFLFTKAKVDQKWRWWTPPRCNEANLLGWKELAFQFGWTPKFPGPQRQNPGSCLLPTEGFAECFQSSILEVMFAPVLESNMVSMAQESKMAAIKPESKIQESKMTTMVHKSKISRIQDGSNWTRIQDYKNPRWLPWYKNPRWPLWYKNPRWLPWYKNPR